MKSLRDIVRTADWFMTAIVEHRGVKENVFTDCCGKEEVAPARLAANPNPFCESIKYLMGDLHGLFMPPGSSSRHSGKRPILRARPGESEELNHVEGGADWKTSGNQEPGVKLSANLSRFGAAWKHGEDCGGGARNAASRECASVTTGKHCWPQVVSFATEPAPS